VVLLDSDDLLAPTAVEKALPSLRDAGVAKVHWPLWAADQHGRPSGGLVPGFPLPEGDLLERVVRGGPHGYATSGMCGSAYARRFLERVFPVWEGELGAADTYLSMLAPLFGRVARLDEPQAYYRMHGQNTLRGKSVEKLPLTMRRYEEHCTILARFLAARGIAADPAAWLACSWFHRLHRALEEMEAVVTPGAAFVLAELDQWEIPERWQGRRRISFLERDGVYWGSPPDDDTAIRELERLRRAGAAFLVIGWPAFWWLDYYAAFHGYLRSNFRVVSANDRLMVFALLDDGSRPGCRLALNRDPEV
jgi:hypothetical protein